MTAVLAEPLPNPGRLDGYHRRAALILDDCEVDRMRMRRLIEDAELPFDLVEADTLEAMECALDSRDFDLILIDFYLGGCTGFDALEMLGKTAGKAPVPIMVTGDEQTDIAVQAIKMGCADYLSKTSLSPDRLKAVVYEAQAVRCAGMSQPKGVAELAKVRMVSRSSAHVRPELARFLRDLRDTKSDLAQARVAGPHRLHEVEQRHDQLWARLRDPGTFGRRPHQSKEKRAAFMERARLCRVDAEG